jgi:hypothetical protein
MYDNIIMVSENDLLHQPDTLQQQPPQLKKKGNSIVKVVFILLLVMNIVFCFWAVSETIYGYHGTESFNGIIFVFYSLPLVIIDFFAILYYFIKHRHHSINSIISVIVLLSFFIITFILTFLLFGVIIFYHSLFM